MGLYYRLDYKNNKNHLNQKDSVPVIIDYYYKGKRTKVSTGVVCQIKDWDDNWRKKTSKDPIKSSDKDYRDKNLLIKNKLDEINGIVLTIKKQDKEPLVELVRSYLRKDKRTKGELLVERRFIFYPCLRNMRSGLIQLLITTEPQLREVQIQVSNKYENIPQSIKPKTMYYYFQRTWIVIGYMDFVDGVMIEKG